MKAVRVHEFGGPEVLRDGEVPLPEPGPTEARVKIEVAGLNYVDVHHRKGDYPNELPLIPGVEGAGVVDAVGSDVSGVDPGDRVAYGLQLGSYAEYVTVPAWKLVPVPDELDIQLAAAAMIQGLTAHYLSHSAYSIQPGDIVLIHAAAGGVGHLLVQMAKRQGARVIGTASTDEKARVARQVGADEVILYTQVDFEEETRRLTKGEGVSVVYDAVGQATFDKGLNCLKPRGYMVLYGEASGPVAPIDPKVLNAKGSLYLTRTSMGHYIRDRAELLQRATDLFEWIAAGELKVRIDKTFSLAEAAEAHRYAEGRKTKGKVLLIP